MKAPFTIALAASLLMTITPASASDPVTDVVKWLGCADYVVEQTANTLQPYRDLAATTAKQVKCKLKLRATPILIESDAELTLLNSNGARVPNYAEGVVGGSGTSSDPYVIGGFEFDGTATSCPAITIRNTRAHILITENWIHDTGCGNSNGAVRIRDAYNVRVEKNRFSATYSAIDVYSGGNIYLRDNLVERDYAMGVPGTAASVPLESRESGEGIHLYNVDGAEVVRNTVRNGWYGIFLTDVTNSRVSNNIVSGMHTTGIQIYGSRGTNFADSNDVSFTVWGLSVQDCPSGWTYVRNNRFHHISMDAVLINGCGATVSGTTYY